MSHSKSEQEIDFKKTSKSTKVETARPNKSKSGLEEIQLNVWLYEAKRDQLTMAEILERRKREAVGGDQK